MTAIEFNNISKQYRLGLVSTKTISHDLNRWWQTAIRRKEDPYLKIGEANNRAIRGESEYVWALRDIDFKVEQGDVLGIIGKNGAGKSTLLKILSKVTAPTTGSIRAKGRIASLLEVGTGFHPEMTGRENIYMNGAIMGMTKREISRKLDEIIDFAGVERYIDTPTKRYSSGMTVRLGFAIAAHLDPEILVVDEVLAVGDAEFQKKAIGKMQDVSKGEGRTVLFVSHNMASMRQLCTSGVLLENGSVSYSGGIEDTVQHYLMGNSEDDETCFVDAISKKSSFITIESIMINGKESKPIRVASDSTSVSLEIKGELKIDSHMAVELRLFDKNQIPLAFYSPSHYTGTATLYKQGKFSIKSEIKFPAEINSGTYVANLYITDAGKAFHFMLEDFIRFEFEGFPMQTGHVFNYNNGSGLIFIK